jgi:hypothetical protein
MSKNEIVTLPMPERLEPKSTTRSLTVSVRMYFYALYNSADGKFRNLLASVGNTDSITGNRLFDRHEAVVMIKAMASKAGDTMTTSAKDGHVYRCLVGLMRNNALGLKLRRREYNRLTHQQAAE